MFDIFRMPSPIHEPDNTGNTLPNITKQTSISISAQT
jgi:hypothetical protein